MCGTHAGVLTAEHLGPWGGTEEGQGWLRLVGEAQGAWKKQGAPRVGGWGA